MTRLLPNIIQSHTKQPTWLKGVFKAHIVHYKMTKPQEAQEALFQQAAVSSSFCRKGLPTTPWIDDIQQNIISKKY
jgi:hypothetical protein